MAGTMAENAVLRGQTILVVEDETLVALELEQMLEHAGCRVMGPVATVEEALELLEQAQPQAALLDVQLLNGMITPVAEQLLAQEIPFVLVSAYVGPELDKPVLAKAPRVEKPVSRPRLLSALVNVLKAAGSVESPSPARNG